MLVNRLIITGGSGWLAKEIARQAGGASVTTIGVSSSLPQECPDYDCVIDNDAFLADFELSREDTVIHCAFSRESDGGKLSESLRYSQKVFEKAVREGARGVINISSQSVYGSERGGNNSEADRTAPRYLYALAKLSSEMLLEAIASSSREGDGLPYSNLRMASIMGVSNGRSANGVLRKFIQRALDGGDITIQGGTQKFSFIDVKDAAAAVLHIALRDESTWPPTCNVGVGEQVGIVDMAGIVRNQVATATGRDPIDIIVTPSDIDINSGMDCSLLMEGLGWKPAVCFADTVGSMVENELKIRG